MSALPTIGSTLSRRALLRGTGAWGFAGLLSVVSVHLVTAQGQRSPAASVAVTVRDGAISLDGEHVALHAGRPYDFAIANRGQTFHRFAIEDSAGRVLAEIPVVSPGDTQQLVWKFPGPGRYRLADRLGGDYPFFASMRTVLEVEVAA